MLWRRNVFPTLSVPSSHLFPYPLSLALFSHARFMSLLTSLTGLVHVHFHNLQVVKAELLKPESSLANVRVFFCFCLFNHGLAPWSFLILIDRQHKSMHDSFL